ncbi:unnamed protein product [Caenorhabditis brenneri]
MGNTTSTHISPQLTLKDIIEQNYREEFSASRHPSPPPLADPIQPFALGAIGGERRREHEPAPVGPLAGIAEGGNHHNHHRHRHRPRPRQMRAPVAVAPAHPVVVFQPRPLCCSFCYGTAAQMAREQGLPVPDKDQFGQWSTHACKMNGHVSCPFLWQVVCPLCGATGPVAHTRAEHLRIQRGGGF